MKLAILISGLPRQWRPSILTQINMLAPHTVDVFFHLWDVIEDAEKNEILKIVRPKAHAFELPQDFSSFDTDPIIKSDNINVPSRMASQFYSWKRVGELFAPYASDYDFALRTRADLQFVNSVNYIFPQLTAPSLVIPWWNPGTLLSDIFALGDPQSVLYYHQIFDHLMYYAKDNPFNAEFLLMKHLEAAQPPIRVIAETNQQWFFVRRPHMQDMSLGDCMKENPGQNKWLDPEVRQATLDFHTKMRGPEAGEEHVKSFAGKQLTNYITSKQKNSG